MADFEHTIRNADSTLPDRVRAEVDMLNLAAQREIENMSRFVGAVNTTALGGSKNVIEAAQAILGEGFNHGLAAGIRGGARTGRTI